MVEILKWNWRSFFTEKELDYAEKQYDSGKCRIVECTKTCLEGEVWNNSGRFFVAINNLPQTFEECIKDNYAEHRGGEIESKDRTEWICTCKKGTIGEMCNHMAALAYCFERQTGGIEFDVTAGEKAVRIKYVKAVAERKRLEEQKAEYRNIVKDVARVISFDMRGRYFNFFNKVKELKTNRYEIELMEKLRPLCKDFKASVDYGKNGLQELTTSMTIDGKGAKCKIMRNASLSLECSCGEYCHTRYYNVRTSLTDKDYSRELCAHKLLLLEKTVAYINEEDPGDYTDYNASLFMKGVFSDSPVVEDVAKDKICNVALTAETHSQEDKLYLTFKVGMDRMYIVKKINTLIESWNGETTYVLGKMEIDFSKQDFNDEGLKWIELLSKQESFAVKDGGRILTYGSIIGDKAHLNGRFLDDFYDAFEGRSVGEIKLRKGVCKANVIITPILDRGHVQGVIVSGSVPQFLQGKKYEYCYQKGVLSRVSQYNTASLANFNQIAKEGTFGFHVGRKNLAEFYYRVLPSLQENNSVVVQDKTNGTLAGLLPPEAVFTFRLDLNGDRILLEMTVAYGDESMPFGNKPYPSKATHDIQQEKRVLEIVNEMFSEEEDYVFSLKLEDEDGLYDFLTNGIGRLEGFGEVLGTSAFYSLRIREMPSFTMNVSVSLESNLLDLEILTKDLTTDELLELLASYQAKKKYHRLKSGDFIDLDNPSSLVGMQQTLSQLNLSMEDVLHGKGHLPLYRALYVNTLLEEHDNLIARRDKTLTSLVRSFKTIKDSDFTVPSSLEGVMRPYQEIGCKWLNVLNQSGFGGILADEMGLGKTLQLLAVISELKTEGAIGSSLVVCPASLVFNWVEEAKRFTPDLSVKAIVGSTSDRKEIIDSIDEGGFDLYVTSYDLLKRDITDYDEVIFDTIALDEAQYIKNQRAAVTKAVKVLKARHRVALTGTPIENRLSELWSIFDFLMPGFLYSREMFVSRFETPIVKGNSEEASQQLKKMTAPFIMRRLKEDVLKDLPAKLEEVRYCALEGEQRHLYDAQVVNIKKTLSGENADREKIKIFAELTKLREICCDPSLLYENYQGDSSKREAFIELVVNAIDGGHRMLVFSQFTSMLALLEEDLLKQEIKFFKITGSTPKEERIKLVNEFNDGDVPVFLISLKAGGTGLNLTGADIVIHYDPWWNVAATNQATDRAHRIGQTKQVTVYKMIAKDTIEEKILDMQRMKKELADAFVNGNGESLTRLSAEELLDLLS